MAADLSSSVALQTLQLTRHPLRPVPALSAARNPTRHNFGRAAAGVVAATSAFAHTASHRLRSKSRNRTSHLRACAEFATEAKEVQEDEDDQSEEFQRSSRLGIRRLKLWPGIPDQQYDFGGLQIPKRLNDAFVERGIIQASSIQKTVMRKLSLGEHAIVHGPTGSGKTLSYLLPALARLQPTMHVGAQVLILVPTTELAVQVAAEAKWLIEALSGEQEVCWFNPQVPQRLACEVLLSRGVLWEAIRSDTAIVVTTPGIITAELKQLKWEAFRFSETLAYFMGSNMSSIIMDEVDSLCPREVKGRRNQAVGAAQKVMEYVVDVVKVRYRNRPIQFISASATANGPKVARVMDRVLLRKYPKRRDISRRTPPQLLQHEGEILPATIGSKGRRLAHAQVPEKILHATVTLKRNDVVDIVKQERFALVTSVVAGLEGKGTVLVCLPDRVKMDDMVDILMEAGIKNVFKYRSLVGLSLPADVDDERMTPTDCFYQLSTLSKRLSEGTDHVLVAKMNACRGIDLQNVKYVVLFGLPDMAGDYLHLAGRTGRMGRSGTTITLVTKPEEDSLLPKLEDRLAIKFNKWDLETASVIQDDTPQEGEQEPRFESDTDSTDSRENVAGRSESSTMEVEEVDKEEDAAAHGDVSATEKQTSTGSRQEAGASPQKEHAEDAASSSEVRSLLL